MSFAKLALILILAIQNQPQNQPAAPRLAGFAVQGMTINLENFKGKQNVIVLFYRTHN